ncbi:MAG: response regulator [Elusimicrobia bacterium]|nr:response regulator [Elusimicrobiota bacterium]
MTVLIVEDDAGIRKLFSYMFRGTGHEALYAEDLAAAAARIGEMKDCALLITDYKLPDGLSVDMVRAFKAKFPRAGVLVATGSLGVDSELRALNDLELSGILRKPFDPDEALELIQLVLGAYKS